MSKRPARVAILGLGIDPASAHSRHRQLYEGIRDAILAGRLVSGTRLPSTRTLAHDVGCSRNTVMTAFEQLAAEGYLESRVGAGTTVAGPAPDIALRVAARPAGVRPVAPGRRGLARRGRLLLRAPVHHRAASPARPFRVGVPALDDTSRNAWTRLVARWTRGMPRQLVEYGDPAGFRPLREAIATYLGEARGVRCTADQVIVVSGSQQGIDLAARVLLDPGDEVWMEDPGYPSARAALAVGGMRVRAIPVDSEGIDVEIGAARAPHARLAYVTPSHQFPLGVTMSLTRRVALLEWARRTGAWILEDDHNSEYRYASRPLAALQGLDPTGCVLYLGTFSKVLFPALRLGYVVAPAHLVDAFVAARALTDRHSPSATQAVLADFIGEGHFTRHVRRHRALYARRQAALVAAAGRLEGRLDVGASDAGMHMIGWLPEGTDDRAIALAAAARGVDVSPLSAYRVHARGRGGLLLGYAGYSERAIREGVDRLERVLHGR